MQNINKASRDRLSQISTQAAVRAESLARTAGTPALLGGNPEMVPVLWTLAGQGQEISNWCCEARFTLKQLRSIVREYVEKVEVIA